MKILWLSHLIPYPPKGGVLQRSYNLIKETSKHHELTLIAFIQTSLLETRCSSVEAGVKEAYHHLEGYCKQVQFIKIPCESKKYGKNLLAIKSIFTNDPYSINWLKSDEMLAAIRTLNQANDFDLVHFDTISLAPYAKEFDGIPKVLNHHNIESHMMLRRAEQQQNLARKLYFTIEGMKLLRYEKKVCPKFDLHLTCSLLDSARLAEIVPALNITETPNGVDIGYFNPQPENEIEKHLVFAGSLNWYPNRDAMHYFAREIWPLVKNAVPDITMNVIGSSPSPELLELAEKDARFIVHGYVDDVRPYLSSACIYVCPIRDGGGTKLKILDAFSMAMATVAHPTACEGIDVTDGKNILLASTPEEFASKIKRLINEPEMRKNISHQARQLVVDKYTFSMIGEKLSESYQQLVK